MASKFGLAGGIPERRVRPIWDAIDSRQFKNALKITTTLLSKHHNSPYALALKALILERMGKPDEALSVCLNAKELLYKNESLLMDDLTLSTLQIVFQRLDHLELATSCYEHACGKFPNNLELMMGLFNCYVREYSFVKQQQTAIKMYKLVGEERFLLWAVCSIQLQVLCGNGGEKLLLLAEGLLKKHVASHGLHEPEALIVYFSILEQQTKYGDALDILGGKLGSLLIVEVDKLRIQGKLLARAGDYAAAANVYQKILELCGDDWEAFLHYLGCLFEDDSSWSCETINASINSPKFVECKLAHLTDEVFNSCVENASAFVQKLQAETSNDSLRNPYLAHLEIERRKCLFRKNNDDGVIEVLLQYYSRFGHLACFTSDIEAFLQVLSQEKKIEFLDKLMKNSSSLSAVPTKALGQSITLLKTQELIGNMFRLSVAELEGSAVQMAELYCKNIPLSKDLDPQESMHGEELLSIACNVLVQLFWRTRDLGYFIEAIMVLEFGLAIKRYAWQHKILLLHLYSYFGALSLAYERYKSLDVKNILMETVSHHILPQMLASPLWADLSNLLKDYLKFMDDHFRESADLTFLAYRHRNYSKVIEFVQFKERLQHSNQYLVVRVEAPILQLKQNADNIEEEESILESLKCGIDFVELSNEIGSKSLIFNEDFQSRPWWTPTTEINYLLGPFEGISYYPKENLTKERETSVRGLVERKSLLPRMIYLSIQSASVLFKDSSDTNGSLADHKTSLELKSLLERYAKLLGFSLNDAIDVVMGVSRGLKTYEVFGSDVIDWLNFAVFFNAWSLNSNEFGQHEGKRTPVSWQLVNSLLENYVLSKLRSMGPLIQSPQGDLPKLVQAVTEPLAWHGVVIQSCVRSCVPSGKKKKKSGSTGQSISLLSHAVRDAIQSLCSILEEIVRWSQDQIKSPEDNKIDILVSSLKTNGQNGGPGHVFHILETLASSPNETELGNWISQALRAWSPVDVGRKIITGQSRVLSEFCRICESKIKALKSLKQQIAQV
ncbi:N-terminal acetyltransferase B complex auxiliary subunit NAA25-like [Hibiscus syriacus]|uniref:N-terminal acetyltransferase B complex auxiliary subunit NAA25-like n=1 Tax=Hibiscus syriacus TaxID=106335 RepID=UPI0019213F2A|nr:N-terminal acetyltransferase B complex auxiliary subunit NAA25-like [Hibiscus syriacus]